MSRLTRSQSRLLSSDQVKDSNSGKRASFSNLTNIKSPRNKRQKISHNKSMAHMAASLSETKSQVTLSMTQLSQTQNCEMVQILQSLRRMLENDFTEVSRRLQLPATPTHFFNPESCKTAVQQLRYASADSIFVAKSLFDEDRRFQFISFVLKGMCGQNEFPGSLVVRCILEMILKVFKDDSIKSCMSVQQTLIDLHSLFTSVVSTFPVIPHRADYLKLFETRFNVAWLKTSSTKQGILHAMLELCIDLIHQGDSKKVKSLYKGTEKAYNFYQWYAEDNENFCFENFQRDEKFERVFLVLDLLVRVLEEDLAAFIVKYSRKLQTCLNNKSLCPLICLVLWEKHESVNILNAMTKGLISTFVTMIGLSYPTDKIRIIARLLNLISHVLNLHEYPEDRFERYPVYGDKTADFVRVIQKTVENSVYYSVDLITSVAEHIRSPLVRMLYADQMLKKITGGNQPISLEVPYKLILNKDFETFADIPKVSVTKLEKYPPHDPKVKVRKAVVTQQGFLKLLEVFAVAVNDYYCVQSGFKALDKPKPEEVKVAAKTETFTFADFQKRLKTVNLDEPVQLRQMNNKRLVSIKISRESYCFFRNEIKHLVLLIRLVKKCYEKYGSPFEDFKRVIETMEA